MTNVVTLRNITRLDIPAERVLSEALAEDLKSAIVVGLDENGDFYFASSFADGGDVLWWLEIAKKRLLDIGDQ